MAIDEEEVREDRVKARRVGRKCGATWAKGHATPAAIERLRKIDERILRRWVDNEEDIENARSVNAPRGRVYRAIHGQGDEQAGKDDPYYFENLVFAFFDDLDTGDWAHHWAIFYVGFVEGAIREAEKLETH